MHSSGLDLGLLAAIFAILLAVAAKLHPGMVR
jgi:hypothetical protein